MSGKWRKGMVHERFVAKILAEAGWAVHLGNVFGADIIAIRKNHMVVFIQVTMDSNLRRKVKKFQSFPIPFGIVRCFIFQAKKKSGQWKYRVIEVLEKEINELDSNAIDLYFDFPSEIIKKIFF